ncbi:hypothetical protein EKPJFOCH_0108 [Methylobacterium thuringiense]|uniref:Uncharacterized protein n=1 Tax=Methylobacterium thuringiense TaxID=1003091 RepID=A0ABQ4TGN8_9HYPH|nr:hypothetical protein EKPJFOCH_0108 [Methylobacterium thuringiense]
MGCDRRGLHGRGRDGRCRQTRRPHDRRRRSGLSPVQIGQRGLEAFRQCSDADVADRRKAQRIARNLTPTRPDDLAERRGCSIRPGLAMLSRALDDASSITEVVVRSDAIGYASDPALVADASSPSTLNIDRGPKADSDKTVPPLRPSYIRARPDRGREPERRAGFDRRRGRSRYWASRFRRHCPCYGCLCPRDVLNHSLPRSASSSGRRPCPISKTSMPTSCAAASG